MSTRCDHCPGRTPFRPDPEKLARAKEMLFQPPLDEGIREIVIMLVANGIETFESCEGGPGHSFPEATVRFEGTDSEGLRAVSIAMENGLPVRRLRRVWGIHDQYTPRSLVGDDLPLTEGFAQEGASEKTPLGFAIVAVTVSTRPSASFILWYIATCATITVSVVNLFVRWFVSFVDGIIGAYFSCHWS